MSTDDEPEDMAGQPPDEGSQVPAETTGETAADLTSVPGPLTRWQRIRALTGRIPHPPWDSRRGYLLSFFLIATFGGIGAVVMISAAHYTETASFCGRCHTMGPEIKAHALSPHRELACAECHVKPGITGLIEAKANGAKQLVQVLTGTFPKPIPPPDHSQLPPVQDTCLRCHSVDAITQNGGPVELVLRPKYQPDQKNTRELIALMIRPNGLGGASAAQGVHWHIQETVTYTATGPGTQKINLVEIKRPNGSVVQYIATSEVGISVDVRSDIARIQAGGYKRVMDCIDCHNRVGHSVPSIDQAVDDALARGRISAALPFIKRDAVALLSANYPTLAAADAAFERLGAGYKDKYPLARRDMPGQITQAVAELKRIYRELATPDMRVQAQTYPDNLGHQTSPGCFRCHDGAHYQVVNGKLTDKVIPSTCATCHTFPQVASSVPSIILAGQPADHNDKLYVFSHKNLVSSVDPAGTTCAACHPRSYCLNCHSTGAAKVNHDEMLYNHAAVIRKVGGMACAYCHQPVYCARCHKDPVLQTPAKPRG